MQFDRKGSKKEEFGLVELIRFLVKCLPALIIFVGTSGLYTYFRYSRDPSYTADGVLLVESSRNNRVQAVTEKIAGLGNVQADDTERMIDKFFLLFYSRDFNYEVAKYIKEQGQFEEVAQTIAAKGQAIRSIEELGDRIFTIVVVEKVSPETFRMNVSLPTPERAVRGLNYMMDYFSALLLERESRDLLDAKKVLERESAEADDRMKAIDREINAFTLKSGNRSTGGPPTGVTAEDKLEEAILLLRGQLNEVRLIIEKATAQAHATEAADAPPIDKYSSGASLSSLHRQESLLSMRLENSRNLLRELRSQPDERIRVQRMIDDLYKRKEFEYHVYSDLRKEAMNIDIQRSTAHNKLKILDRPSINNVRTGETLKPLLIERCFMAAVFAIILVFFRDLFNPLIRSRKELDDLGLYYVGSVPDMSRKRRFNLVRTLKESLRWLGHRGKHGKHHTAMNTYFEMVFKNIAARILNYHDGARPAPKVVSVMSSVSAEGKTTIAESLARVLAKSGKRTLLVDADLRRRTLTRRLGYIDAPGIADFLQHRNEKFSEPVVKSIDKNFEFMPSGASVVDAMELISSVNYNDFIEAMRHYYEVVVIDTPPCIPCSEVIPLANTSDMVVLSVNLESTLLSNVEDTIEKLNLRNEIPLAYVMNMDQKVETLTYYSDYFIVPQSRTAKPAV